MMTLVTVSSADAMRDFLIGLILLLFVSLPINGLLDTTRSLPLLNSLKLCRDPSLLITNEGVRFSLFVVGGTTNAEDGRK